LATESLANAFVEGADFFLVIRVVDAHHGDGVADALQLRLHVAANTFGRRIWRIKLRVGLLEVDELLHQAVVFTIADLWLGQDVIEVIVVVELFAKFEDPLLGRRWHVGDSTHEDWELVICLCHPEALRRISGRKERLLPPEMLRGVPLSMTSGAMS